MTRAELVEKVARGICEADGFTWEEAGNWFQSGSGSDDTEAYLTQATAALAAIEAAGCVVVPGWQPMETAPKNASRVLLRYPAKGWNKPQVIVAHWAHGGGDEQPPFGPAWFYAVLGTKGEILMFAEAPPSPDAWMPLHDSPLAEEPGA